MKFLIGAVALLVGSPAAAEVVKSGEHGFELRYSHVFPSPPGEVMEAFAHVDQWWPDDHSYSGDASNLSMKLQPGGCFCERLPQGGGIEHLRVTYVDPGKRVVLTGSLGPLLYEATAGVLDIQFKPVGRGTKLEATYRVAGFANGEAAKLAPLVDQVMGGMFSRFSVYATPPRTN